MTKYAGYAHFSGRIAAAQTLLFLLELSEDDGLIQYLNVKKI